MWSRRRTPIQHPVVCSETTTALNLTTIRASAPAPLHPELYYCSFLEPRLSGGSRTRKLFFVVVCGGGLAWVVSRIFKTNHLLVMCDQLDDCACIRLLGLLEQCTTHWAVQTTEMAEVKVPAGEVPSEGREGGCSSPLCWPLAFAGHHWGFQACRCIALVSA